MDFGAALLIAKITPQTKLGDLRQWAKEVGSNHELALELWKDGRFLVRMLALLILDTKALNADDIQKFLEDIQQHPESELTQLADWLLANQLVKQKKHLESIGNWREDPLPVKRRLFWYFQGRLRWMGKNPLDNSKMLVQWIEQDLAAEIPYVQWAMNFTAGWIGIYEAQYRQRITALGEKLGLYKDQKYAKGCTPNYLPEFIRIEVDKRGL